MRMKNQSYFYGLLVIVSLLLSSCQEQRNTSIPIIDLAQAKQSSIENVFTNVEIIPLQNKVDKYLPDVNVMYVTDDGFIVCDSRNIVYSFTKDGKYISDSENKFGNGPGEYSIVTAFSYNPYSKLVEIATPRKLLFYDKSFSLKKEMELPTKMSNNGKDLRFFGHIYDLAENRHVLLPDQVSNDKHTMMLFDSSSSKVLKTLDFDEDILADINMQTHCFFNYDEGQVSFLPPFLSTAIYSFDKDNFELSKRFEVKFGNQGLSQADFRKFGKDKEKLKAYLMSCDKEIPVTEMELKNHIVFVIKKENDLRKWFTLIYNKSSKQILKINNFSDKTLAFPIVKYVDKHHLYGVVEKKMLPDILKLYREKGVHVISNDIADADYYVLKYSLE